MLNKHESCIVYSLEVHILLVLVVCRLVNISLQVIYWELHVYKALYLLSGDHILMQISQLTQQVQINPLRSMFSSFSLAAICLRNNLEIMMHRFACILTYIDHNPSYTVGNYFSYFFHNQSLFIEEILTQSCTK